MLSSSRLKSLSFQARCRFSEPLPPWVGAVGFAAACATRNALTADDQRVSEALSLPGTSERPCSGRAFFRPCAPAGSFGTLSNGSGVPVVVAAASEPPELHKLQQFPGQAWRR